MTDRKNKNKKAALVFSFNLKIIIGIIIIFILASLFALIYNMASRSIDETRCKASVTAYAKLNSLPYGDTTADPANIECPTQFITIEKQNPVEMKRDVANLMYDCWNNFGEGKLLLFRQTDEKFCVVCSVIDFEDRSTRLDRFATFLMQERIPNKRADGTRPTYYDYIAGHSEGTTDPTEAGRADIGYLDGGRRYAIMFTYYKESFWNQARNFLIYGAIASVVVGALTMAVVSGGTLTPLTVVIILGVSSGVAGGIAGATAAEATTDVDWDARLIMTEYTPEKIQQLGCGELPISMVDEKFR
jgi:hypothetical protein